jgi:hypothetical protein
VSVETFTNIITLRWFDLSYNNLRNLDINILRALLKFSGLYLYGNRLQCDSVGFRKCGDGLRIVTKDSSCGEVTGM